MPEELTDGHAQLTGVDGTIPVFNTERGKVVSAVNRSFRLGKNQCRPGIASMALSFDTPQSEQAFKLGAISSGFGYGAWRGVTSPRLMVAVHDRILAGEISGNSIHFSTIKTGLKTGCMMSYFAQANDRVYWQNDIDEPVAWDGIGETYRPGGSVDNMPRGSAMHYANGRMAVCADKDYMILSDYVYGNGLNNTKGIETFIEYQYYNDIGAIGTYAELGSITGFTSLPVMDTVNGTSDYLVVCPNGFWTFDPSGARSDWLYGSRQKKSFEGNGCPAPYGFVIVGSDLFYQSTDGSIESYRYVRNDMSSYWGRLTLSNEVAGYLVFNNPDRRKFVSLGSFDNRVVASTAIQVSASKLGGWHRFGTAMLAMDVSRGVVTNTTSGFSWDGLWTGPNPIQFVPIQISSQKNMMILSHDDDGQNRVYQFNSDKDDSFNGRKKKIFSFYDTPYYFCESQGNQDVIEKRVEHGKIVFSGLLGSASLGIQVRSSGSPGYSTLMRERKIEIVSPDSFEMPFYSPQGGVHSSESQDRKKCGGVKSGIAHQFRITCRGGIEISKFVAKATKGDELKGVICSDEPCKRMPADDTDLFRYKIATDQRNERKDNPPE